jgi:hypothetical protein
MHIIDQYSLSDEKKFYLQHSLQVINLECDSNSGIYELAPVCDVTRDRPHIAVPIIFAPIKTETQVS